MKEIIIIIYIASVIIAFLSMKCARKENNLPHEWGIVLFTIIASIISPVGILIGLGALLRALKLLKPPKWM